MRGRGDSVSYPVPRVADLTHWERGAIADLYERAHAEQWRPLAVSRRALAVRWDCSGRQAWGMLGRLEGLALIAWERGRGTGCSLVTVYCPGRKRRSSKRGAGASQQKRGPSVKLGLTGPQALAGLGVDVRLHFGDIRRITLAKHGAQARIAGIDPDDLVARVVERVMVANTGASPFNASKGSLSAYIYRQGRSALLNLADREARRRVHEVLGEKQDAAI